MSKSDEEQPQYVYFVTNDGSEAAGIQPQIVFTAESLSNVVEDVSYAEDESSVTSDIWSKCNNALRDLLVFLVKKHRIEEVMDSKMKALQWEKLTSEFYTFINHQELVSKPQIVRKWHNWKQYNKAKKKPHPFDVSGELSLDVVREKCQRLLEISDLFLPLGSSSNVEVEEDPVKFSVPLTKLNKVKRRDFLVRRTGASASALSAKRLEHELVLESLQYEQERWKIKAENQLLVKDKLIRKLQASDTKLETAKLELELLKSQFSKENLK